jgi:FlaA1/EpsC-like NDP-sugar epimerase
MLAIGSGFPRSVYLVDFLICFLGSAGGRFGVRLYHEMVITELASTSRGKNLLIYGAGSAGLSLVREIKSNPRLDYRIVGFLDEDPRKLHSSLMGVPVIGRGRDLANIVHGYKHTSLSVDEIVIAMPSASGRQIAEALANCRATGLPCKTIPSLGELLAGKVRVSEIREISVEDLLGREQVQLEEGRIRMAIAERTVMVTGAGGSIGSELCHQLARNGPKMLVLFDQAESDLFRIEMELNTTPSSLKVTSTYR